jgi:glyoxylase-like metal-dependent hydrolase (beta-lactamase superfamily II)
MILQRTENPQWLSNAYLVVDRPGGHGVLIDGNDVMDPLVERVEREGTRLTHILLTHHHGDHIAGLAELKERLGAPVLAHPRTVELLGEHDGLVDGTLDDGERVHSGELEIEAIHTPGHAAGHLALNIDGTDCVTADVLFRGTVGGTMAPGATGFADLKHSVMQRLMALPGATRIHPGHRQPSTIAREWEGNPFVRVWRGLDAEDVRRCRVGDRDATLVLWAPDYDGGHKAWVRFADADADDAIVGGSWVTRDG